MSDALLYHNPRCSKSRKALQIIQNHNINIKVILYLTDKLTKAMLKEILDSSGLPLRDIIRSNEKEYKENNLDDLNINFNRSIYIFIEYFILIILSKIIRIK